MKRPVRVLIVDDSASVRGAFRDVIEAEPDFTVAGEAADGEAAIEACLRSRPDVIALDMAMPGLSGLEVTRWVMRHMPVPILVVSSSLNRSAALSTFDALAAGAIDVLDKGAALDRDRRGRALLCVRLRTVAKIPVLSHVRPVEVSAMAAPAVAPSPQGPAEVFAIGASTGGPRALTEILNALPRPLPVPVLAVLHIGERFAPTLALWLESVTGHRVRYAGAPCGLPQAGGVWLAPPRRHLVLGSDGVSCSSAPAVHGVRPSVDVLFESVAATLGSRAIGVLLTGMGRDGAEGLSAMREAGATTLAQDEESSTVWGMPGAAVALDAASEVLPLVEIAPALLRALAERS